MSDQKSPDSMGEVVAKCWKDAAFKKRFVADPGAVLREHKIEVPAGIQLKVVENTNEVVYLTLPASPVGLSDSDLEAAAGGVTFSKAANADTRFNNRFFYTLNRSVGGTCGKDCRPW